MHALGRKRVLAAATLAAAICLVLLARGSETAVAAPACSPAAQPNPLLTNQGHLESVIVGGKGRLYFTTADAVMVLDSRTGPAKVLAHLEAPGGLAFDTDGGLIVGSGNTIQNGATGDDTGPSKLFRIDTNTGHKRVFATGLSMGNGLVRGLDGSFFASNDVGKSIDRIRGGKTQRNWATVQSGNGLTIDPTGRYLYAAQTFVPAAISRVDLLDPAKVTTHMSSPSDASAGLDGMARDARNDIFVAANGGGEIWRVDPAGTPCVILDNLPPFPDGPSAVAVGKGMTRFPATNLYIVTFDGNLIELPNVADTQPAPGFHKPGIRLTVSPRRAPAGQATTFRFKAVIDEGAARPIEGARVHLGGRMVRTDEHGIARMRKTFRAPGRRKANAGSPGLRRDSAALTVFD
jgi:sugar lactone lactonase YvrE